MPALPDRDLLACTAALVTALASLTSAVAALISTLRRSPGCAARRRASRG